MDQNEVARRFGDALDRARRNVPSRSLIEAAKEGTLYLIDCDFFFAGTKADFAERMGWHLSDGVTPDRKRVEDVCNLTRDQELWPEVVADLGGLIVAYSPSKGGMVLVDQTGETPLGHLIHVVVGDLEHQTKVTTIHRRRIPTWEKLGSSFANSGDLELAALMWSAVGEIKQTGFVALATEKQLQSVLRTRGFDE